jgi:hypothetical protein
MDFFNRNKLIFVLSEVKYKITEKITDEKWRPISSENI